MDQQKINYVKFSTIVWSLTAIIPYIFILAKEYFFPDLYASNGEIIFSLFYFFFVVIFAFPSYIFFLYAGFKFSQKTISQKKFRLLFSISAVPILFFNIILIGYYFNYTLETLKATVFHFPILIFLIYFIKIDLIEDNKPKISEDILDDDFNLKK